jgi:hypothetical protein
VLLYACTVSSSPLPSAYKRAVGGPVVPDR